MNTGSRILLLILTVAFFSCGKQSPGPILNPPQAAFTYSVQGSLPVNVQFVNTSVSVGPAAYMWNFGDGSATSSLSNPVHSYAAFGIYTVSLIQVDSAGITDTISYSINTSTPGSGGSSATSPGVEVLME